jgi:hypothetical protein
MANDMKLSETQIIPEIQAVSEWCRQIGRSHVTVWRWKENGWITTINIAGRPYITREAILEFKRRAVAGEFSKPHHAPVPPRARDGGGL